MGIQQIFVSHAGKDTGVATELALQLRNAGHDARIDTRDLALGDNAIEFMNEGISNAAAVIILFSRHSLKAEWQKLEIDAARWNEVAQGGGRCIVVRLDDTPLPPTLGPKAYGRLKPGDRASLRTLVEDVCRVLFSGQMNSSLVAEAFRPDSPNPFRHLRAEFFEDQPELHAKTFALPEAVKVGALDDMKPCILEGSRGTGKSMLLLSLRARNRLLRLPAEKEAPQRFGFYLKLTRGAICNAGARFEAERLDSTVDTVVLTDVAEQELTVQMTESLFSELDYCAKHGLIECDRHVERRLCEAADDLLFDAADGGVVSFVDLQGKLGKLHKRLAEFIRRRFIYQEQASVPTATFDLDQFKRVVQLVRRNVPPLASSTFVVLLDEYENLLLHQKRLVNSLVKLGAPQMSVKISRKLASGDTPATTTGQELQEIHDYTRVPLVYNLDDPGERKAYCGLLRHMVENMVALEGGRPFDMDQLLPRFGDPEVEQSSCLTEVARLNKMTVEEFNDLPDDKRREKKTYYGHAAVYRVLLARRGRHREKRFAGFSELAMLGSGVIRYFQEFLSVGYHLTFGAEPPAGGSRRDHRPRARAVARALRRRRRSGPESGGTPQRQGRGIQRLDGPLDPLQAPNSRACVSASRRAQRPPSRRRTRRQPQCGLLLDRSRRTPGSTTQPRLAVLDHPRRRDEGDVACLDPELFANLKGSQRIPKSCCKRCNMKPASRVSETGWRRRRRCWCYRLSSKPTCNRSSTLIGRADTRTTRSSVCTGC